jgi:hypothetical protein
MTAAIRGSRSALFLGSLLLGLSMLSGCKGGGGGANASAKASSGAPTISGNAPTAVKPNATYSFKPTATDPDGDPLSFEIENKPDWATFNTVTGELTGSASDGKSRAQLKPFTITVSESAQPIGSSAGAATLAWTAPTENIDGTPLTDLSGYVIAYGTSSDALTQSIIVDNPSIDRYVVDNLAPGTYYFAVRAVSASGAESELSARVTKSIG